MAEAESPALYLRLKRTCAPAKAAMSAKRLGRNSGQDTVVLPTARRHRANRRAPYWPFSRNNDPKVRYHEASPASLRP